MENRPGYCSAWVEFVLARSEAINKHGMLRGIQKVEQATSKATRRLLQREKRVQLCRCSPCDCLPEAPHAQGYGLAEAGEVYPFSMVDKGAVSWLWAA